MKKYIFGYGSLVSAKDAGRTLGRQVKSVRNATLRGWIRDWSTVVDNRGLHKHYALSDSGKTISYVCALNVCKPKSNVIATNPNGVLIEVSDSEIKKMDKRETSYMRKNVTEDIVGKPENSTIYTYVCLPSHYKKYNKHPILPSSYLDLVIKSFKSIGPKSYSDFIKTTRSSKIPVRNTSFI